MGHLHPLVQVHVLLETLVHVVQTEDALVLPELVLRWAAITVRIFVHEAV